MRKNTASKNTPALPPVTDSLPTKQVPAVVVVGSPDDTDTSTTLIVADDAVIAGQAKNVATQIGTLAFQQEKTARVAVEMAQQVLHLRRMFPASEKVRAILGEDAADLIGETDAYQKVVGEELYSAARKVAQTKLRREGYVPDMAETVAKARVDSLRKSISRYVRIAIEGVARDQENPALFLVAHGFSANKEVGKDGILKGGETTLQLDSGEWTVTSPINDNAAQNTGDVAEPSDQVKPGETAEAVAASHASELAGDAEPTLSNPKERVHLVVGELRTVASDKRWGTISGGERLVESKVVLLALSEFLTATVAGMTDKQRDDLVRTVKGMAAEFIVANQVGAAAQ